MNKTVTRYKVEFYLPMDEEKNEAYVYAESVREAKENFFKKNSSLKNAGITFTAFIPEEVPAIYKECDEK